MIIYIYKENKNYHYSLFDSRVGLYTVAGLYKYRGLKLAKETGAKIIYKNPFNK